MLSIVILGYCAEHTVKIGSGGYSFNDSFDGSVSFSREKCENGMLSPIHHAFGQLLCYEPRKYMVIL